MSYGWRPEKKMLLYAGRAGSVELVEWLRKHENDSQPWNSKQIKVITYGAMENKNHDFVNWLKLERQKEG